MTVRLILEDGTGAYLTEDGRTLLNESSIPGQTVTAQLISQISALFTPGVSSEQSVDVDPATQGVVTPSPTILAGSVVVNPASLDSPPIVYAPGMTQDQLVAAQFVVSTIQAYSPDVGSISTVLNGSLSQLVTVYTLDVILVVQMGELIIITQVGNPRVFVGVVPTNYQWSSQLGLVPTNPADLTPGKSGFQKTR